MPNICGEIAAPGWAASTLMMTGEFCALPISASGARGRESSTSRSFLYMAVALHCNARPLNRALIAAVRLRLADQLVGPGGTFRCNESQFRAFMVKHRL